MALEMLPEISPTFLFSCGGAREGGGSEGGCVTDRPALAIWAAACGAPGAANRLPHYSRMSPRRPASGPAAHHEELVEHRGGCQHYEAEGGEEGHGLHRAPHLGGNHLRRVGAGGQGAGAGDGRAAGLEPPAKRPGCRWSGPGVWTARRAPPPAPPTFL